jgi:hypothetical protein
MEGLCRYWGIYVTAKPDTFSHGSEDAGTVIDDTIRQTMGFESSLSKLPPVDLAKQLLDNVDIAQRHFKCLLLARLHVLRMFLEIIDSLPGAESDDTYRKRWLELQIRPSLLGGGKSDIFRYLTKALIRETSQPKLEISELDQLIQDRLDYITPRCTPEKKSTTAYIYIVADEVQHALTQLPDAFRSSDGKLCRSVFREMIQSWAAFTGVIIVAAGTGVDSEVLEDSMHSAVQKYSKYERFFDTGSFSTEAKTMQEAYMKRFIPSDVVNHDVFKGLISRTTYWLKGR